MCQAERGDVAVARVKDLTEGIGAHFVPERAGTPEAMIQAIKSTAWRALRLDRRPASQRRTRSALGTIAQTTAPARGGDGGRPTDAICV